MPYDSSLNLGLEENPYGVPDELFSQFEKLYKAINLLRQAIDDNAVQIVSDWVPVLNFGGNPAGIVYSVQQGKEIQLGTKAVFIDCRITLTNKGVNAGAATITGILTNSSGLDPLAVGASLNMGAGVNHVVSEVTGANIFLFNFAAGASAQLTNVDFTNNSEIILAGLYRR